MTGAWVRATGRDPTTYQHGNSDSFRDEIVET